MADHPLPHVAPSCPPPSSPPPAAGPGQMASRVVCGEGQKEASKQLAQDFNPSGASMELSGAREAGCVGGHGRGSRRGLVLGLFLSFRSHLPERPLLRYTLPCLPYEGSLTRAVPQPKVTDSLQSKCTSVVLRGLTPAWGAGAGQEL